VNDGTVVANVVEPGSIVREMSVLLGQPLPPLSAPSLPLVCTSLMMRLPLAQRLYESTTSLADIKRQYANLRGIFQRTRNR